MNFGTPVPLLIGIVLIISAIALFFLDKLKPGYERDSDKVYAVLCLISGIFLLGHLTMELLPSFQQLIMAGMLIAIMIENIGSRTPKGDRISPGESPSGSGRGDSNRSGRSSYRRDSRMNVQAELENEGPIDRRFSSSRRMLGSREDFAGGVAYREDRYSDAYGEAEVGDRYAPRSPSERPVGRLNPSGERIRRRRPRGDDRYGDFSPPSAYGDPETPRRSLPEGEEATRRPRPVDRAAPRNGREDSYIDYRPTDYPEDDRGGSGGYPSR